MGRVRPGEPDRHHQDLEHAVGQAHGSVEAPDKAFAEWYAREQYGRRGESVALWVVPRDAITEVGEFIDELQRNYHRVDGYPLKEARERAVAAGSEHE